MSVWVWVEMRGTRMGPPGEKNGTDPGDIHMADRYHAYIEEAMR